MRVGGDVAGLVEVGLLYVLCMIWMGCDLGVYIVDYGGAVVVWCEDGNFRHVLGSLRGGGGGGLVGGGLDVAAGV